MGAWNSVIHYEDILDADVDFVVIPVNSEGVTGAGLAQQFAARFPDQTARYRRDCYNPTSTLNTRGYSIHRLDDKRDVVFFVTKKTWREDSTKAQLRSVFKALMEHEERLFAGRLVATPPLGCGCGKLKKAEVIPYLKKAFITLGSFVDIYDIPRKQ